MKETELTIITPAYNEEENVATTVKAINQTMENFQQSWELILVNDGSIDKTFEIAHELEKTEPNLKVNYHQIYSTPV